MSDTPETDALMRELDSVIRNEDLPLSRRVGIVTAKFFGHTIRLESQRIAEKARADIAEKSVAEIKDRLLTAHAEIAGLKIGALDTEKIREEEAQWMDEELQSTKSRLGRVIEVFKRYVQWHGPCVGCHPDDADPVADAEALGLDNQVNEVLGDSVQAWTPTIQIKCETQTDGIGGTTSLNVIRVERENDGSYTVVTDHWPAESREVAEHRRHVAEVMRREAEWKARAENAESGCPCPAESARDTLAAHNAVLVKALEHAFNILSGQNLSEAGEDDAMLDWARTDWAKHYPLVFGPIVAALSTTPADAVKELEELTKLRGFYHEIVKELGHDCVLKGLRDARHDMFSALGLVARIREVLGDHGKRMQDELIEYCEELAKDKERLDLAFAGKGYGLVKCADRKCPECHGWVYTEILGSRAAIDVTLESLRWTAEKR